MNHPLSILVVDDEVGLRDFYRFALEPLGYAVTTASDGVEGVELVRQRPFDLIFLDVHMPRMRGPEALMKIRELRPTQKVVITSSSSDPTYVFEDEAKRKGAIECLMKPCGLDEILAVIKAALGGR